MVSLNKNLEEIIAGLEGVRDEVHHVAEVGAAEAEARLAAHHYTGDAKVTLTHGKKDSFVNLEDPAALSIEFGGYNHWAKRRLPGLYIITGAMNVRKGGWGAS
jgi:hypothetical protein